MFIGLILQIYFYFQIARGFYKVAFAPTAEDKSYAMERIVRSMKIMEVHLVGDFFGGNQDSLLTVAPHNESGADTGLIRPQRTHLYRFIQLAMFSNHGNFIPNNSLTNGDL